MDSRVVNKEIKKEIWSFLKMKDLVCLQHETHGDIIKIL